MKCIPIKVHSTPPSYDGFWSPETRGNPYLEQLYNVSSGRLYRVSGFPPDTIPSTIEGQWTDGDKVWAKAAVYRKGSDDKYIALSKCCDNNRKLRAGNNMSVCAFTLEEGRIHIRHDSTSYRLKFTPCSYTEVTLIKLWGDV